jgi:hypothetical protein
MAESSTMRKARFPVIRTLSDYALKVGEIPFPPDWIPEGDYNGVVKELKEKMKDYNIQLVHIPKVDDDMLIYLPPLLLPSRFEATPFPINVRKSRGNEADNYLNCGIDKNSRGPGHVYEFDERGDYLGMWEGEEERKLHYVEKLRKLFESDKPELMSGIDAIRLRKIVKEFSFTQLEESKKLFRQHGFEGATFKTTSHYACGGKEFISQLDIVNARKRNFEKPNNDYSLYVWYKYSDKNFKDSPNIISILIHSGNHHMLTSESLKFLEEFCYLF